MRRRFCDSLRKEVDLLWERIFTHPFLIDLGEGQLPLDVFRFYVKQDYVYLLEFSRCLGIAAAKAEDRETMRTFASLLDASFTVEVEMLERLGQKIGIAADELRTSEPAPTNVAYTRHLLSVAYAGTVGEIMAAMLPCMWSYQEIGERLLDQSGLTRNPIYSEWCATYRTQEYMDLVSWYRRLVDDLASESGSLVRKKMRTHFVLSSRYEYLFWDMAYRKEAWPL
ncbi:MAG: thiaminase II [Candidatus Bathyarchaeota archaeon]|nr:thiaminase II [Candidatus Bathyarchaeota archaeon]